ncbi:hypothetical protein AB0L44_47115 [Nonomuraea wenchangensis]|uniref:HNH endonuclease n=1 Tax=Nonomuraea wenchangensis TaxID=568860 RepID=UPI00341EF3AE
MLSAVSPQAPRLVHRLLGGTCEIYGIRNGLHVHHLRKLADLSRPSRADRPPWVELMAQRRRKALAVCSTRHHGIHNGRSVTEVPRSFRTASYIS